jgi:hypothetical protein
MTYFIIGGSNSIFKDGWVSGFAGQVSEPCVNRSVGSTTTLAGLYRFLLPEGPQPGDCVIWEYALNEINHISRGYDTDIVLKNVEHLIRLCRQRGCRLAPVIFTPRREEMAETRDPYYQRLHELFAHYGVAVFDVSDAYRKAFRVDHLPAECFIDNAHYAKTPAMLGFIADGAVALARVATVPGPAEPLYTAGRALALIDGFQGDTFSNALMTIPMAKVPASIDLVSGGQIIAVYALCFTGFESGIRMELHDTGGNLKKMRFSTTHQDTSRKPLLKAISLEQAGNGDWPFSPGYQLKFFPARKGGRFYSEFRVKAELQDPVRPPPVISGVLVEVDGA